MNGRLCAICCAFRAIVKTPRICFRRLGCALIAPILVLKPDSEVRPWLYAIAVNLCRNRARDGARRAAVIVADDGENPAADRIGKTHRSHNENDGYAAVRLRELMSALPAKQRDALQLRYFAGLDYAEIAAALDCSQEGARANVSQAMRKLKSMW